VQEGDQGLIQQGGGGDVQQAQQAGRDQTKNPQTATQGTTRPKSRYTPFVLVAAFVVDVALIGLGIAGEVTWAVVLPCVAAVTAIAGLVAR
jgi:hypothetical protein